MKNTRIALATIAALAAGSAAFAEIKINDSLSTSGYVVGSYRHSDTSEGEYSSTLDHDVTKLGFTYNLAPVTGNISFLANGSDNKVGVLDAFATYSLGSGVSVTGGKFLSYLGYEAFDVPAMTQLTYANGDVLGIIPGYHSGIRLDYSDDVGAAGVAVVDSIYGGEGFFKGDAEVKKNIGLEAFYSYKGVKDLTIWTGIAYEGEEGPTNPTHDIFVWDLWASYNLTKEAAVAAEYAVKDGGKGGRGYNWLGLFSYAFTDKISGIARISGQDTDLGEPLSEFTRYTLCPTYTLTANLSVRAEYSYTDYKAGDLEGHFFGVQGIFKF